MRGLAGAARGDGNWPRGGTSGDVPPFLLGGQSVGVREESRVAGAGSGVRTGI